MKKDTCSCGKPSDQDELSLMTTAGERKKLSLFVKTTDGTTVDKGLLTAAENAGLDLTLLFSMSPGSSNHGI